MDDLFTTSGLEDLDGSLCLALLQRLHESGALSDVNLRDALRLVAADLLTWLLALDTINFDQLRGAFREVVVESNGREGGKFASN